MNPFRSMPAVLIAKTSLDGVLYSLSFRELSQVGE